MRTFGVEEELLLVDAVTGVPVPAADAVLEAAGPSRATLAGAAVEGEMQQEMLEVVGTPHLTAGAMLEELTLARAEVDALARGVGARAVALAASPLTASPHPSSSSRYLTMMATYGVTARECLACGFHTHVSIESREEGVAVLDRIRVWLPVLLALSANSPFAGGIDTGHASHRAMTWRNWPCAGPNDVFGSVEEYDRFEAMMLGTGVLLDAGMLYFDARLSRHHPTVEVRIADVCLLAEDAVVVAALARALVETAAREWRSGDAPLAMPAPVLKLASWQSALTGVRGPLVDPRTGRSTTAACAIEALLRHVSQALGDSGDREFVADGVAAILRRGTGADQQRLLSAGGLRAVVRGAAELTTARMRLPEAPVPSPL